LKDKNILFLSCLVDYGFTRWYFSQYSHSSLTEQEKYMKQPRSAAGEGPKRSSSASKWFLLTSLIVFVLSCAAFGAFIHLNRTIKVTGGKVVDTYSKKAYASRKQTYDQEYDVIRYTIAGKEYTGTVAAPRSGGSQYVTVFYYQRFPQFAWYNKRSNPNQTYSALLAALAAVIMAFSLLSMRKRPEATGVQNGKRAQQQRKA
jgi:flagellar basal body-associated protein FliL